MKLIIDGNNLGYRARSSSMDLYMKDGTNVTATFGFLKMLSSYMRKSSGGWENRIGKEVKKYKKLETEPVVDDVFVCWDGGKSAYRKSLYPDYKGHRERKRKERTDAEKQDYYAFLRQLDELHEKLPHLGVHSVKVKGWEADDLVYILSKLVADDITIVISTDRDMLQLVSDTVFVWYPGKEELITPGTFEAFTGVRLDQYLDYRVLVGDKSDNIDGIKGIGDKKAKTLLMKYGSLANALLDERNLRKSVVTSRIFDDMDIILRNVKLMNLSHSTHKVEGIEEIVTDVLSSEKEFNPVIAKEYLMSKEFVKLLMEFETWAIPYKNLVRKTTLLEVNEDGKE